MSSHPRSKLKLTFNIYMNCLDFIYLILREPWFGPVLEMINLVFVGFGTIEVKNLTFSTFSLHLQDGEV